MPADLLAPLDSFPYRNRLLDIMAQPPVTAAADVSMSEACALMSRMRVSSVLVTEAEGRLTGILTDGDVVKLISRNGAAILDARLAEVMSAPVSAIQGDSFLYVAIARMNRLGVSHLPVVDSGHRPIGMVTARQLLRVRAERALMIGDDVAQAASAEELGAARGQLPALAAGLRRDGTMASIIAGIIAGVVRDITRRAAELVEQRLAADGWGAPPAAYALLVLGSAGRGESLLAFDQDNALVHRGPESADPWFAEFGKRLNQMLDLAGIEFCKGGVMAENREWRHSFDGWEREIRDWVFQPRDQSLLNIDIFFDLEFVWGDAALAEQLRGTAYEIAGQSGFFLQLLAQKALRIASPLGAFGRFETVEGRLDAKKFGLMPLVSTVRVKAIQAGIAVAGTRERLRLLVEAGRMHEDDRDSLCQSLEIILQLVLDQQLADLGAGRSAGNKIAPSALKPAGRQRLRRSLERIRLLRESAQSLMSV